jgi:ubiquinone/menaquinone biosynthesis C-methylase UbiE
MSNYINNTESAGELARLIKQSILLDACRPAIPRVFQGRTFGSILDIGCGPGSWAMNISTLFPGADIIGIDISRLMVEYATARASILPEKNVCFEVKDALNPLQFPFENEDYDFINLALASSWVPTVAAWMQLLQQCFAMAQRGGIVAVTESEIALTNSQALNRLQTILLAAFQASGRSPSVGQSFGVTTHLGRTLRAAGFQQVTIEVNTFDFSYYNQMENMAWRDTIPILIYETKTFLLNQGVTTEQELEEVAYQAQIEMYQEDFCGIAPVYTFTGVKEKAEDAEARKSCD